MNTILQKRIEEAAKKYAKQFEQVGYDDDQIDTIEEAIIYGATLSLQNQWISAEEALPELVDGWSREVLVLVYGKYPRVTQFQNNKYGVGWNIGSIERMYITHWMPIPQLKGGEK